MEKSKYGLGKSCEISIIEIDDTEVGGDILRKKIQDLAYARFQYDKPTLKLMPELLELEVLQEEGYQGSFQLNSTNGILLRGMVTSSHPRMECLNSEFDGTDVTLRYEFHSEGLIEGDVQKGEFTIICNGGEYTIPYVITITRFYTTSSIGKIRNLFDFANLAQVSYEEAFRIFQTPFFANLIKETEVKERLLYRAVLAERATMQGMEEFLIGIRKKQRVSFTTEDKELCFDGVQEDIRETIRVKKEQWGYLELAIESDSSMLIPVKNRITTADFIGNYADIEFIIRADGLHKGNNYGRITITGLYRQETCDICVRKVSSERNMDAAEEKKLRREKKQLYMQLTRLYLDFRMQRIVTGVWSKESCICLERLRELEPENLWYALYQAQTLLINKQRQEAEWILDDFRRKSVEKDSPLYAFYLYLCTLQENEPSYVARTFRQIQEIYHKNQEDIRLFFVMLFLDPQLNQSGSRKLSAIEEKVQQGMYSPILYMEAYYLIRHDVYLLQKADDFEMQLLHWAVKEGELTPSVANRMNQCMAKIRRFHPMWYQILKACYQVNPEQEMLKTICSFCIKWNLSSEEYFNWYDKGIQEELRLAGLYEAWLHCADVNQIERFPRAVMIYFQYQSNLNYRKQALLYASIVKHKANQKSLYETYQKNMEHFALEQLLAGRIDENLAILYEEFLKHLTVNQELSQALAKTLYTHRFSCRENRAVRVIVVHHELKHEQKAILINGQADIGIYSDSHCILLEDERGTRYLPPEDCKVRPLIRPEGFVKACMAAEAYELPHLVHYFEGHKTAHTFREGDLAGLLQLLESDAVSMEYKNEMKPQMIEYGYHFYTGNELDEYLKQVDYEGLRREPRNQLMELMIARGVYDRAYEMLLAYGSEQASIGKLLLVAGHRISEIGNTQDQELLGLCKTIFGRGKYNESILKYLCRYYQGSIREMERLWKAAREFELDTYELEERFLVQLLYTEGYAEQMENMFQSYFEAQGQEMIVLAYLSYFSYQYFVKDIVISDRLFVCIQQQLLLGNTLNDSCRLAWMLWATRLKELEEKQQQLLEECLQENLRKGMKFAFYMNLPYQLQTKFHLYDRMFLEYRTNPACRVILSYSQDGGEYLEEEMEQMYEGIFVKSFVVFFGEEIPYFIKEVSQQGEEITESGHIRNELMTQENENCYELLNDMTISHQLKDIQTLQQMYLQYLDKERRTEELFRPL